MIAHMTAMEKAEGRTTRADFIGTFYDPLQDWQIAGLAILLYKGGVNWEAGSFDHEGKANLALYASAADAGNRKSLSAYIENIGTALAGRPELQKQLSDLQAAMKAFIGNLTTASPWTYCGTLQPDVLTRMVKPD